MREITRHWRVDVAWWTDCSWRAYHKLVTDTGMLLIIYQDLVTGRWYVQRLDLGAGQERRAIGQFRQR